MGSSLYKLLDSALALLSVSPRFDLSVHKYLILTAERLPRSTEEYSLGLNVGMWPTRACSGPTETVFELGDSLQAYPASPGALLPPVKNKTKQNTHKKKTSLL